MSDPRPWVRFPNPNPPAALSSYNGFIYATEPCGLMDQSITEGTVCGVQSLLSPFGLIREVVVVERVFNGSCYVEKVAVQHWYTIQMEDGTPMVYTKAFPVARVPGSQQHFKWQSGRWQGKKHQVLVRPKWPALRYQEATQEEYTHFLHCARKE